jgi:uncharacterized protein (TIGR03435 family)
MRRTATALLLASHALLAQTPAFEVASIKRNQSETPPATLFPLGPGDAYSATGGRFRATNQPLINYLRFAYRLGQDDLRDLPKWVYSERFDIEARATGDPTKDQMRLMMRSLLTDRFRLAAHTEQRTQPIFELTLAEPGRMGPQLRPHRSGDPCDGPIPPELNTRPPSTARAPSIYQLPTLPCGSTGFMTIGIGDRGRIVGNGEPMERIAEVLRGPFTGIDRSIRDATGLTGTFDLSLEWSRRSDLAPTQDDEGPPFLEALQKQLGLKLRSTKGPVDVLIVDRVERPTEN